MADIIPTVIERFSNTMRIDLTQTIFGNTIFSYVVAIVVFIVLTFVFRLVQWAILRRLASLAERTKTDIDDTFINIVRSLRPSFYYVAAFLCR